MSFQPSGCMARGMEVKARILQRSIRALERVLADLDRAEIGLVGATQIDYAVHLLGDELASLRAPPPPRA